MKKSSLFAFAFISLCFQKSEDIDTLIQKEYNKIEFVSDQLKENLAYLKTNESTDKSIIHIGDSHVQIGSLYQGIKETLKSNNININEGWFYPAGLQKDYYHPFFNVTNQSNPFIVESIKAKEPQFEVGITGRTFRMSAEKNVFSCSSIRSINTIEFLHKNTKEIKIVFGKRLRFNCKAQVETKEISPEYAVTSITFKKPTSDFKLTFENKTEKLTEFYAVRVNHLDADVSYSNFGVSGSTYKDFLSSALWQKQLIALKPTIIFITLGTNDSYVKNLDTLKFKTDLENFTQTVKTLLPRTTCVFMSAPDTKFKQNYPPSLAFVNRTIYEHCKSNNLAFWNWNAVMGGYDSMQKWENNKFSSGDWLHFSSFGYQTFGKYFVEALFDVN